MVTNIKKTELDSVSNKLINESPVDYKFAVDSICKIIRGNNDEYKIHHVVEEVWSLRELLKHFFEAKPVAIIKEKTTVFTTESVPENIKLFAQPQLGLSNEEIDLLSKLALESENPLLKVTVEKLNKLKN